MPKTAKALTEEFRGIWNRADAENRELTATERKYVERLVDQAQSQHRIEQQMRSLGQELGAGISFVSTDPGSFTNGGGPGDRFVASTGYKQIKLADSRPQQWSTGPVEVSTVPLQTKGTLLEGGAGGPGGGLVPPYYQPGIASKLFEPLGVSDLFGSSTTTASQVRYINEGTALSGAAGVPEAGVKPESTLAYSEVVEPIKKIATLLGISDEMIEDAPSIQSYLNQRLSLFISIEEERQLLRGNGTNELIGLLNRSGGQAINQYTKAAADDNTVGLLRVLNNTRGSSFLEPDAIIMHPSNWLTTRLLRDGTGGTVGQYFGGGPFTAAYGGPQGPANAFSDSLWGKRVVLSTVVGAGTALVGSFGLGAHIWRRGGVSVEASNSHSDWFQKDLVALRAESRLGLGLYRPSSFTEVRGLS
jgi:HK97 family phage major capsid protein